MGCLLKLLAAGCCATAAMITFPHRIIAAAQALSPQESQTSCPHSFTWEPTELELRTILARHHGWLEKALLVRESHDEYLDRAKFWRFEALSHPERANLCRAALYQVDLRGANLISADLHEANLGDAQLDRARLGGADLRGATFSNAHLSNADLSSANLQGAGLGGADLRG